MTGLADGSTATTRKPLMTMDNDDAISMAKKLISEQGVLCGISSGCNVAAALRIAARPEMKGKNIVTFICDTGERYLSTQLFKA